MTDPRRGDPTRRDEFDALLLDVMQGSSAAMDPKAREESGERLDPPGLRQRRPAIAERRPAQALDAVRAQER